MADTERAQLFQLSGLLQQTRLVAPSPREQRQEEQPRHRCSDGHDALPTATRLAHIRDPTHETGTIRETFLRLTTALTAGGAGDCRKSGSCGASSRFHRAQGEEGRRAQWCRCKSAGQCSGGFLRRTQKCEKFFEVRPHGGMARGMYGSQGTAVHAATSKRKMGRQLLGVIFNSW